MSESHNALHNTKLNFTFSTCLSGEHQSHAVLPSVFVTLFRLLGRICLTLVCFSVVVFGLHSKTTNKFFLLSDDFSSFCFVVEFMTENNGQCKHQEVSHFVTSTNKFRAVGEISSAEDANHSHSHFPSPLKLNNHMVTLGFLYAPVSRFIDENLFLLLQILLQLPFLSHTPQPWKL